MHIFVFTRMFSACKALRHLRTPQTRNMVLDLRAMGKEGGGGKRSDCSIWSGTRHSWLSGLRFWDSHASSVFIWNDNSSLIELQASPNKLDLSTQLSHSNFLRQFEMLISSGPACFDQLLNISVLVQSRVWYNCEKAAYFPFFTDIRWKKLWGFASILEILPPITPFKFILLVIFNILMQFILLCNSLKQVNLQTLALSTLSHTYIQRYE